MPIRRMGSMLATVKEVVTHAPSGIYRPCRRSAPAKRLELPFEIAHLYPRGMLDQICNCLVKLRAGLDTEHNFTRESTPVWLRALLLRFSALPPLQEAFFLEREFES